MTTVVPLAKETYDRRDEQNFREYTRRNLMDAKQLATNAADTADAITMAFDFTTMPVYADNAAATVGGLTQGTIYRTAAGQLMIKL